MTAADLTADLERLVENMSDAEIQEEVALATAEEQDEEQPSTDAEQAEAEHEEGAPEDRAGDPLAKVRREAASYRVKLREAEGERDRLAGVVESMQRAEAERLVADAPMPGSGLAEGADLWRGGVELAELLDDGGNLDHEKLNAARDRVVAEHPHWRGHTASWDGGVRGTAPADPADALSERLRRAGAP